MFISVTSPVVLCMYNFVLNLFYLLLISFLQTRVAAYSIKRVCTSGWFLCELMKITTARTILTNVLKSLTFEAQNLKIIKNVQPTPKN